jgi:hypothetical protein
VIVVTPLRPDLYCRLHARFGTVRIAHEGEEMLERIDEEWVIPDQGGRAEVRRRLTVLLPGEYYRISCPFCTDTRHRLWINHRWGLWDPRVRSRNLFLAISFNEECLSAPGRALQLWRAVDDFSLGRGGDRLLRGERPAVFPREVKPAGNVDPLRILPNDHPAKVYLRSRGYDPDWLSREFHVGYCSSSYEFPVAEKRIIVPVLRGGRLMGWQARYVGDPPDDVPKYYTMPGMRKKEFLYNHDSAARFPFVVVTEGVTDVWSFGPEAVALLGKKISGEQTRLIASTWDTVVVMLDGDAPDEAREVYDALGGRVRQRATVTLRPHTDPGDYERGPLRRFVYETALEQGVSLGPPGATPGG